jgi:GNAT superfamily N-acetyltransferase
VTGHREQPVTIAEGPRPGAREAVVAMHAVYYSKAWGFGPFFQAKVGREFDEFLSRYDASHDRVLLALSGDTVVGSLIVDGGETTAATRGAHLRWFVVDEAQHGRGVGKSLMAAAMDFIASAGFARCYLTTFAGLDPARALYERSGFRLVEETRSETWGTPVTEQLFEWTR